MDKISIIGTGNVGSSLGKGWANAGHTITFGVPDPSNSKHKIASELALGARVMTVADAALESEIIVLAVPWDAVPEVITTCGCLSGRLVIDATNPLSYGPDGVSLAIGFTHSGGEEVARLAPRARVCKAMNQVGFAVMSETAGYLARPVMFIAGDDENAKNHAISLVQDLGFEAYDAGGLKNARLLEPYAMLWIDRAMNRGMPADNAFALLRKGSAGSTVEYIRYNLVDHSAEELLVAYSDAAQYLKAAPECLGYQLSACTNDENVFILRINWESHEAHMQGFRKGPNFPPFLNSVRSFIPEIDEMKHYTPTAVEWVR